MSAGLTSAYYLSCTLVCLHAVPELQGGTAPSAGLRGPPSPLHHSIAPPPASTSSRLNIILTSCSICHIQQSNMQDLPAAWLKFESDLIYVSGVIAVSALELHPTSAQLCFFTGNGFIPFLLRCV
mmetsp:Transcript_64565/g.112756  ORF Transcript_64565/g.112756 Transcript_64565/m.112756 type:complete len:125 (-) Transcript_64565:627-1001(-)